LPVKQKNPASGIESGIYYSKNRIEF